MLLVLAGKAPIASAQTLNPRVVEFTPSADHSATNIDGTPVVSHYDFEIYMQGAAEPIYTQPLGKPAPALDGKVRVDFSTMVASWGLPVGVLESRVAAEGSGGRTRSTVSNTFQFVTCSFAVSVTSMSADAAASNKTVGVVAPAGCAWTSSSNQPWVTVTGGAGTTNATVAIDANPDGSSRTARLTIAGTQVDLTQSGAACTYTWSPAAVSIPAVAATGKTATLQTLTGCSWTASSSASWLTLTTSSGSGGGAVTFAVSANTGPANRQATVTVNGQAFSVTQAGTSPMAPGSPQSFRVVSTQ